MQITARIYIQKDQENFYLYVDCQQIARFNSLQAALMTARVWRILIEN